MENSIVDFFNSKKGQYYIGKSLTFYALFFFYYWMWGLTSTTHTIMAVTIGLYITIVMYNKYFKKRYSNGTVTMHYLGIFLFCLPWHIGNNLYSVFGGRNDRGSVYSIVGLYQDAAGTAFSLGPSVYQRSKGSSVTMVGCSFYQKSDKDNYVILGVSGSQEALGSNYVVVGISGYQESIVGSNNIVAGISFYQKSMDDNIVAIGISGYQDATDWNVVIAGISGYQKADTVSVLFVGIAGYQKSKVTSGILLGVSGYQESVRGAKTVIGITGYQKADTVFNIGLVGAQRYQGYAENYGLHLSREKY